MTELVWNSSTEWDGAQSQSSVEHPDDKIKLKSDIIGETGSVALSSSIDDGVVQSVSFSNSYNNPVVVSYIATRNGNQSIESRVKNVTGDGCDIFLKEPDDGVHSEETVCYLVVEQGVHSFDGKTIEAGIHSTSTTHASGETPSGDTVSFSGSFGTTPVVVADLNTNANQDFASTMVINTGTSSFDVAQEIGAAGSSTTTEDIAYIAWEPGKGSSNGFVYDVSTFDDGSSDGVENNPQGLPYQGVQTAILRENFSSLDTSVWSLTGTASHDGTNNKVDLVASTDGSTGNAIRDAGTPSGVWSAAAEWSANGDADVLNIQFFAEEATMDDSSRSADNGYFVEYDFYNDTIKLIRKSGGSASVLESVTETIHDGGGNNNCAVEYDNGTVTVYWKGSQMFSYSISSVDKTYTGFAFTGATGGLNADIDLLRAEVYDGQFVKPALVSHMQTMNGGDGGWARSSGHYWGLRSATYAEEDQVGDTERNHTNEEFGLIAFTPDVSIGGMASSGSLTTGTKTS